MLTPDEIEACVLGAQWVVGHADPALARAAQDLMAKVAETVPERLRPFVLEPASRARSACNREPDRIDMVRTRTQIHEGKKITLNYRDEHGRGSQRTIWPIAVGYHEAADSPRRGANCARISAVFAPTASSMPVPRRKISGAAQHPAGKMAAQPGLGSAQGYLKDPFWISSRGAPHSALNDPMDDPTIVIESPCQACGACCSYSANWPRFTIEDDAALDLIPEKFVNERLSGMRCDGDRCSALSGKVGEATACLIYAVRPDVCRTCMPGDVECAMARKRHGLPVLDVVPANAGTPA